MTTAQLPLAAEPGNCVDCWQPPDLCDCTAGLSDWYLLNHPYADLAAERRRRGIPDIGPVLHRPGVRQ